MYPMRLDLFTVVLVVAGTVRFHRFRVTNNHIVIAIVDGELTVKRLKIKGKKYYLVPENDEFEPILIQEGMDFIIWGVVTYVIHKV